MSADTREGFNPHTAGIALWVRKISGTDLVFPGHPVVLACAVMALYDGWAQASAPVGDSLAVLCDSRIPAAHDHLRAAVFALQEGGGVDAMLDTMRRYWSRGQAGGNLGNVDLGIAQAIKFEPIFRETALEWLKR